ncbi:MAG: hypothetical protein L0241_29710, partial [Planctomycetia bacterium]|nr:hypothetical protein [Planctomycetia bacterium]
NRIVRTIFDHKLPLRQYFQQNHTQRLKSVERPRYAVAFVLQAEGLGQRLSQAFSLPNPNGPAPRALPWAMLSQPFGLKTNSVLPALRSKEQTPRLFQQSKSN